MSADYWAFRAVSLGPAVVSRINSKSGDYFYEQTYRGSVSLHSDRYLNFCEKGVNGITFTSGT